tara:strand:+ start:270 stop:512 length:243 start_codon:yes stop_codon:yes gene_type:complete
MTNIAIDLKDESTTAIDIEAIEKRLMQLRCLIEKVQRKQRLTKRLLEREQQLCDKTKKLVQKGLHYFKLSSLQENGASCR